MIPWLRRRGRGGGFSSPRVRLLELAVAARYNASRLGLLAARLRRTYERTQDPALLRMLRDVLSLQAVLEILSVRLETLAEVGAVTGDTLGLLRSVLTAARQAYGALGPSVDGMLAELENLVASIAASTGIELEAPNVGRVGEEARRVLEEARVVAEERLGELLKGQQGAQP